MRIQLLAIFAFALLLAGCTINPQDLGTKQTPRAGGAGALNATSDQTANQTAPTANSITLTTAEVAKHSAKGDCWMIINGTVYDLSNFTTHPGGDAYVPYCGTDATEAYATKGGRGRPHSARAESMLPNFEVGPLGQTVSR